jgi:hypothetical protein
MTVENSTSVSSFETSLDLNGKYTLGQQHDPRPQVIGSCINRHYDFSHRMITHLIGMIPVGIPRLCQPTVEPASL